MMEMVKCGIGGGASDSLNRQYVTKAKAARKGYALAFLRVPGG